MTIFLPVLLLHSCVGVVVILVILWCCYCIVLFYGIPVLLMINHFVEFCLMFYLPLISSVLHCSFYRDRWSTVLFLGDVLFDSILQVLHAGYCSHIHYVPMLTCFIPMPMPLYYVLRCAQVEWTYMLGALLFTHGGALCPGAMPTIVLLRVHPSTYPACSLSVCAGGGLGWTYYTLGGILPAVPACRWRHLLVLRCSFVVPFVVAFFWNYNLLFYICSVEHSTCILHSCSVLLLMLFIVILGVPFCCYIRSFVRFCWRCSLPLMGTGYITTIQYIYPLHYFLPSADDYIVTRCGIHFICWYH